MRLFLSDIQRRNKWLKTWKKEHLRKVQLCLEDQRHQGVQSDPVREGGWKHRLHPHASSDTSMQAPAKKRWEHMAPWGTECTPLIGPVSNMLQFNAY